MGLELSAQEKNALKAALRMEQSALKKPAAPQTPVSKPQPKHNNPPVTGSTSGTKKTSKFDDLESVTVSLTSKPKPWKDGEIKNIKIAGVKQLDSTTAIAVGTEAFRSVQEGKVSSHTIDQLLSLAVSMFKPSGSSSNPHHLLVPLPSNVGNVIRDAECELTSQGEAAADALKAKLTKVQTRIEKAAANTDISRLRELESRLNTQLNNLEGGLEDEGTVSNADDAYAYTYIAAYIMRLAGKTADAWAEKLEMAKTRFNSWYDTESGVLESLSIDSDQAEKIREGMARRPDCISTWVLWASYNENENTAMDSNDAGILRYLATQMYSYTGMHAYASIMQLQIEHNVTFKLLLEELNCPVTRKAVYEVADIIRFHEVTEKHPERKTYFRYARVWDSGFFVNLQSKNCAVLGYTVAKTRKMLSSSTSLSDPTQAFAFKNMDDKIRSSLDIIADRLYDKIMTMATQDEESGSIWKIQG